MTDAEVETIVQSFIRRNEKLGVETRNQDVKNVVSIADSLRTAGIIYDLLKSGHLDVELSCSRKELLFTLSDESLHAVKESAEKSAKKPVPVNPENAGDDSDEAEQPEGKKEPKGTKPSGRRAGDRSGGPKRS